MKYIRERSIAQFIEQFCQNLHYIFYTVPLDFAICTYKKRKRCWDKPTALMVRVVGLEPTRLTAEEPKGDGALVKGPNGRQRFEA